MSSGRQFAASGAHALVDDWITWLQDQSAIWATEWRDLASRGLALATGDPFIAALVQSHLAATCGTCGLQHLSLYDSQPGTAETSGPDRAVRRNINAITNRTWYGRDVDIERTRTRLQLERDLAYSAFVTGEGIAIRVTRGSRSAWRTLDAQRVANPWGVQNSELLRDGFVLDEQGAVIGMFVHGTKHLQYGLPMDKVPAFVPWYAPDGTPNVIHRTGFRLAGMIRGVSRLAPMILMARQLGNILESMTAAKRLQALYGLIVEAADEAAWTAAQESGNALDPQSFTARGPLNLWVVPPGGMGKVQFTTLQFNGADVEAFLRLCWRVLASVNQYPVDVVLCQMGESSLSSARAGLDQYDRTGQLEQGLHAADISDVIDLAALRDAVADGSLVIPGTTTNADLIVGKRSRPPRFSTDLKKDAETVAAMVSAGISRTTAFERVFGLSYEDEVELKAAEATFTAAQSPAATADTAHAPAHADEAEDDEDDEDDADTPDDEAAAA